MSRAASAPETKPVKAFVRQLFPRQAYRALRELRELPPSARSAWLRAAVERSFAMAGVPALPGHLPRDARIVFVCHGNIYRSPLAAALFRSVQAKRGAAHSQVTSAGILEQDGRPSPPDARQVAEEMGVSLASHASQYLSDDLARSADLVVVMDRRNEALLRARFPSIGRKLLLLGALDPQAPQLGAAIEDPYGKGIDAVRACYSRIARAVTALSEALAGKPGMPEPQRDSMARRAARRVLSSRVVAPLCRGATQDAATIFMLHRFTDPERGIKGDDPLLLARHLEYLRRERFNIVALGDLVARWEAGEPAPAKTVCFTVDDGYIDFATVGAPVFARFDVPATLFVVSGLVDGTAWAWYEQLHQLFGTNPSGEVSLPLSDGVVQARWTSPAERGRQYRALLQRCFTRPTDEVEAAVAAALQARGVALPAQRSGQSQGMHWEQVREWSARGMHFGPHSETHPVMARCTDARARAEITRSWTRLREEGARAVPVYCYPFGLRNDYSHRDEALVREAGLSGAVAAFGGHSALMDFRERQFALPRFSYEAAPERFLQIVNGLERVKQRLRGGLL